MIKREREREIENIKMKYIDSKKKRNVEMLTGPPHVMPLLSDARLNVPCAGEPHEQYDQLPTLDCLSIRKVRTKNFNSVDCWSSLCRASTYL